MRHLIGFVVGLIASAAVFFGAGWGAYTIFIRHASGATLTSTHGLLAIGALAGTAMLLGLLAVIQRIPALAPGLPGLALLGWSVLLVLSKPRALRYIPLSSTHSAVGFTSLLTSGAATLIGIMLIMPLFVPSRWRRRDFEIEAGEGDEDLDVSAALGLVQSSRSYE